MKYARLSLSDLEDLEQEFVEFLILNGITAEDWVKIKEKEKEKAEKIIDQFSDVVWEGVLRKNEMIEKRSKNKIILCRVSDSKMETLFIEAKDENLDLMQQEDIETMLQTNNFHVNRQESELKKDRQAHLFEMITLGFYLTNNQHYRTLFTSF